MTDSLSILAGALSAGQVELVDLSATITPSPPEVPEWQRTEIVYSDHSVGAAEMQKLFGVPAALLRNQEGPATEYFARLVTHNTTHVDAPRHYNSRIQGRPARSIDALPLSWFVGAGVVVDMTGREDGDAVTETELKDALERQSHVLARGEIVLVRTGCDRFYGLPEYAAHGPGISPEATMWLYQQGIRVMGIDAWGWDSPVALQAERAVAANRRGIFWGAHQIDREYAQIERLVNLGSLPFDGFLVICLPLKVADGSAGPARAVAVVPRASDTNASIAT